MTVSEILSISDVSQYLVQNNIALGSLFGTRLDPRLGAMIYTEKSSVAWAFDLDSTYSSLPATSAYLYSLLRFNGQAAAIVSGGGGGSVAPSGGGSIIKSPIRITSINFATATAWNGSNSDGITISPSYTLQVYWNDIQRFLVEGSEWSRTSGGIEIINNGTTITGFSALSNDYELYIYISL